MKFKEMITTLKGKASFAITSASLTVSGILADGTGVLAAEKNKGTTDLSSVTSPIIGLINSVLNVAIPLVGAAGALYCVLLGVKFARAEEPPEREKAKQHLKNAIIGFVLIFVLIVALRIATPLLTNWMNSVSTAPS